MVTDTFDIEIPPSEGHALQEDGALRWSQVESVLLKLAAEFPLAESISDQTALRSQEEVVPPLVAFPEVDARYQTLVEQIPAIVFMAFLNKGVGEAYVSPQIKAILGFSQKEWLNDPLRWYQQIHPDDKGRCSVETAALFMSGQPLKSRYRVLARDGHVVWFHCEAKIVRNNEGRPWFIHGVALDISELNRAEASVQDCAERLKFLSHRLMEVQEAERRNIALELHDEVGQILTGLKLTLEMSMRLPADEVSTSLDQARVLIDELMARVRKLSLDLRPAMLDDLGLIPTLLWHIEHYTAQTKVRVTFKHSGLEKRRFGSEVETAAYRMVQEALTNIARHAHAQEATVRLSTHQRTLVIEVEDRGSGFDLESVLAASDTSGLAGMRERADLLGGRLTIESHSGAGTRLTAELSIVDGLVWNAT
jgi:PAS domain S-box-containing protein